MKIFKEQQRFTQLWLIILLGVSSLIPLGILLSEYIKGKMNVNELIIISIIIVFSTCFIFIFKLKTRIDKFGVHYQFFPIHFSLKTILWSDISKAYVKTYSPLNDFGGWGLKGGWSKSKGKAINVSGDIGIQLELKNGKKLLIGTQKENEAKQVLTTYATKIKTV